MHLRAQSRAPPTHSPSPTPPVPRPSHHAPGPTPGQEHVPGLTQARPQVPAEAEERAERTARGLLLRGLRRADAGAYRCAAVEQGFSRPLRRLVLHVLSAAQAERLARSEEAPPVAPPGPKLWYRDFLQLVEPGGGGSSLRMCRPPPAPPEPRRKGRNRRTHVPEPRAERGPRSAAH